jgi:hypothetical protein
VALRVTGAVVGVLILMLPWRQWYWQAVFLTARRGATKPKGSRKPNG